MTVSPAGFFLEWSPRRSYLLMLSGVSVVLLLAACSGSSTQDVLGSSSGASASSSTSSTSSSSSGTSGNATSSSGTTSGATTSSSGTTTSSSGTTGNCTQETEPNDNANEANTLAPAICGDLSKGDSVDYLTFTLHPATKTMSINFTGRVRLRVDVAGKPTTELTPDNAGVVPFVSGEPYTIQVTALNGGDDTPWRVEVIEQ